jgi:porin
MKKLALVLAVVGSVVGTALADEDRRDHDWNDDYWHHHHYGYWHGERGYWRYHDHEHEFIRAGPAWSGLRTRLANKGITFNAQYAAEVWGNPTGGQSTGTGYTGLMTLQGNVDLQKLVGWQGASVSTRWYWLSGQDISATNLGNNIFTVSNIAEFPTFRMNEVWFQQNFLNDRISIRLGQLGADSEFDISTYSAVFLNGTFGWSPYLYTNIPNGGPQYPMGAPGVRLALTPLNWLTYQAGFQGNIFAQNVNRHGFRWDLSPSNGYFSIHELIFRTNQGAGAKGLPGEFKIGGWFDTAPDPDAGSTQPWNYGLYFIADQMLYRVPQSASVPVIANSGKQTAAPSLTDKGLGAFTHIGLAPRNSSVINFYVDCGLNYKGLIPTRDNDVLGVAFAYGHLNNNPKNAEENSIPGYEIAIEATYQIELTSWFSLQPDLQYVLHPSGTDIANALVLGARATISF